MKPRGVSWILAAAVGIFVILAISLSIADLPDYSIRLQQSKAAFHDWFSSSGLINKTELEDDIDDDYYFEEDSEEAPEVGPGNLTSEAHTPALPDADPPSSSSLSSSSPAPPDARPASSGNEEDVSVSVGGDTNTAINGEWKNSTSGLGLEVVDAEEKAVSEECNIYSGSWVRDESYPLFQPFVCPFIDTGFRCVENGRRDTGFLQWRWQPSGCNLPRFDAVKMLKALRGKRLIFVGDSLGRNQWESFVCMLYQGARNRSNVYEAKKQQEFGKARRSYTMIFKDYKLIVEYYRSHFLVMESRRPPGVKRRASCSLTLDRLDKSSPKWGAGDILVFNSGHWWTHTKVKNGKCYFIEGSNYTTKMSVLDAYKRSLQTWASWVDTLPGNKRVFFRGFAPSHFSGGDWDTGGTCDLHMQPLGDGARLGEFPKKVEVVEKVLKGMKTPVTLLNVTYLSMFRKDGHIANWGRPKGDKRQDCSHWCLPGVPDTWNHLLYAALLQHS